MFKEELHKRILKVYAEMQSLKAIIEKVKNSREPETKSIFLLSLIEGRLFEGRNLREIINSISRMRDDIFTEMHKYRSFSWILLILIIMSAIIIGLVDILKGSDYFKEIAESTFNSTSNLTR
jgi:hypothetical protein